MARIHERIFTSRRPIDAAHRGTGGGILAEGYAIPWDDSQSSGQRLRNKNLVRGRWIPSLDQDQFPEQAVAVSDASGGRTAAKRDHGVSGHLLHGQLRNVQRSEPGAYTLGGVRQVEARPGQQAYEA